MNKNIALLGNPNVGKTSLFNELTNTYQKVGNWTGVTVDICKEKLYKDNNVEIIDLPGLYSLETDSLDVNVVLDYLKKEPPDVIVNVIDGMNLERNLSLTLSLLKLGIPIVVAINFCDEIKNNNVFLDVDKLSKILSLPVIEISAKKKINLNKLISVCKEYNDKPKTTNLSVQDISKITYHKKEWKNKALTHKIDDILLSKYFAIPIFIAVIFSVYFLSLKLGGFFGGYISDFFMALSEKSFLFFKVRIPVYFASFISSAVIKGVGGVLSFLPQIVILFLLLSFLEESGYMSRVAFLLDGLFSKIGLNGKSIFPLVLSMGCTVTGLTATRVIENDSEREKTIFLIPFMPCSAKVVVFAWFSNVFFNGSPLIATFMYFLSFLVVFIVGRLTLKDNNKSVFVLEMPVYRLPKLKNIINVVLIKIKEFLFRAGSIIFTVSVVYWFMINFGTGGYTNGIIYDSFLYRIGNALKYFFYPLGLKDYRIGTSIVSGLVARESVIETLSFFEANFDLIFNDKLSVIVFLTFILLSPPCVSALAVAKKELKSRRKLLKMIIFEISIAYIVALFVSVLGRVKKQPIYLILFLLVGIMIIGVKRSIKKKRSIKNEN